MLSILVSLIEAATEEEADEALDALEWQEKVESAMILAVVGIGVVFIGFLSSCLWGVR